jgi:surface polysaccharide O-acyltransferase-like enzyme
MTNQSTTTRKRIYWIDNLRTIIIFLVVLYHAGGVYSFLFESFWLVADPATSDLVGIFNVILDICVMPTMFFIAGYVTPMSLKNKNGRAFLETRFRRLMIPWAVAVLTLIPLYKVIFLYSRGLPQEHWTTYFHFSQGNISSQNWLWFLPVLFLFNMLYVLLSKANIRLPHISLRSAAVGIFVLGVVYSLSIGGIFGFRSWTHTPLIDFENEKLLVYFMVFLLGALCFRQNILGTKPQGKTLYTVVSSIIWIPITIHIAARVIWLISLGPSEDLFSPPVLRLIWWLSFYLSLLGMLYLLVQTFRRYVDKTGKIWDELNRNSYGVYIIHVSVIGMIALPLLNSTMPSLLKYLILTVLVYGASNLIVSLYRRVVMSIKAMAQSKTATNLPSLTVDVEE